MAAVQKPVVVLHVEDDIAHALIVRRILSDLADGVSIRHVADGQAALDYLGRVGDYRDAEESPRPDVILLDLRLPRVDGLEVLRTIKSNDDLASIPVVALTTSDARRDITTAYRHHINGYLTKASEHARLVDQLGAFATYWLTWNSNVAEGRA